MRADKADGGFMPPVTSRPGMRPEPSIASGDRLMPPSVFQRETPPATQPEEPAQPFTLAPEEDAFEPWAEAAVGPSEPEAELPSFDEVSPSDAPAEIEELTPLVEEFALDAFLVPEPFDAAPAEFVAEETVVEADEEPFAEVELADTTLEASVEETMPEADVPEPVFELPILEPVFETPAATEIFTEAASAIEDVSPSRELAERFDRVAHELRDGDTDAVIRKLAAGDRLDALLAGLLAGFLSRPGE